MADDKKKPAPSPGPGPSISPSISRDAPATQKISKEELADLIKKAEEAEQDSAKRKKSPAPKK